MPTRTTPPTPEMQARKLREAIAPYVALDTLRAALSHGGDLRMALREGRIPESDQLIELLAALVAPGDRRQIRSPADVAAMLLVSMSPLDQEELRVISLDTKNRVLAETTVYVGSVNSAQIRVGEIFKAAIRLNAVAIIIAHNHPSGDPTPSPEDILVTRQIVDAGRLLDIDALDHLVIGHGRYVSMRERGLGFPS